MFNVDPSASVPGFRVGMIDDVPGISIDEGGLPRRDNGGQAVRPILTARDPGRPTSFAFLSDASIAPDYVPGGEGGGDKWEKSTLMPGTQQFGFCFYLCPDGTVRREHEVFECRPWIYRFQGYGL
jgi:hypothetical protein